MELVPNSVSLIAGNILMRLHAIPLLSGELIQQIYGVALASVRPINAIASPLYQIARPSMKRMETTTGASVLASFFGEASTIGTTSSPQKMSHGSEEETRDSGQAAQQTKGKRITCAQLEGSGCVPKTVKNVIAATASQGSG